MSNDKIAKIHELKAEIRQVLIDDQKMVRLYERDVFNCVAPGRYTAEEILAKCEEMDTISEQRRENHKKIAANIKKLRKLYLEVPSIMVKV